MFCSAVSILSHFSRLLSNFLRVSYIIDPCAPVQFAYYMLSGLLSDPWIGQVLLPLRNCSCCSFCLGCFPPTLCKVGCSSALGPQLKCHLLRSLSWRLEYLALSITSSYLFLCSAYYNLSLSYMFTVCFNSLPLDYKLHKGRKLSIFFFNMPSEPGFQEPIYM